MDTRVLEQLEDYLRRYVGAFQTATPSCKDELIIGAALYGLMNAPVCRAYDL